MDDFQGRTVADSTYEQLKDGIKPDLLDISGSRAGAARVLLLPKGMQAIDIKPYLDKYLPAPERRQGLANFTDLKTFLEYVTRFASEPSVIFAVDKRDAPKLHAVFNHHPEGADETKAGWSDHRATYHFPLSKEWNTWIAKDSVLMSQREFAEHIEDNILDIRSPAEEMSGETGEVKVTFSPEVTRFLAVTRGRCATQAEMVTLSRGMKIHEGAKIGQQVNLQSGEQEVSFESTHTGVDGGKIDVPSLFQIGIPIFHNGEYYSLAARLRYRIVEGKLKWGYQIHRPDKSFDHAFNGALATARADTGLPVFIGNL